MSVESRFPRLTLEELTPQLREAVKPMVDRMGYFGDFFAVFGHNPAAVLAFMEYTKAVKAPLSDRQNEVIALVVCTHTQASYERIQHERLCRRLGFAEEWISELTGTGVAEDSLLQNDERELRDLSLAVLRRDSRMRGNIERVRQLMGNEATVAAVQQIARFQTIAYLSDAFDLKLPEGIR